MSLGRKLDTPKIFTNSKFRHQMRLVFFRLWKIYTTCNELLLGTIGETYRNMWSWLYIFTLVSSKITSRIESSILLGTFERQSNRTIYCDDLNTSSKNKFLLTIVTVKVKPNLCFKVCTNRAV